MAGSDVVVKVGGITAADVDQTNSIQNRLPLFIVAVILLALLLLVAVFRSVVVAAQAAVSNLLSIAAAYGVVAYAAQGGWLGDLVGITDADPHPGVHPDDDVRDPVRPLHGLRGLPPVPDPRGVPPDA